MTLHLVMFSLVFSSMMSKTTSNREGGVWWVETKQKITMTLYLPLWCVMKYQSNYFTYPLS